MRKEHARKLKVGDFVIFRPSNKMYKIIEIISENPDLTATESKTKYPLFFLENAGWVTYLLLTRTPK